MENVEISTKFLDGQLIFRVEYSSHYAEGENLNDALSSVNVPQTDIKIIVNIVKKQIEIKKEISI